MHLREFQSSVTAIYGARDRERGRDGTFRRLVEEVGELARALRDGTPESFREEVSDVLAWTTSVASLVGVDLEQAAAARYAHACPKCQQLPCACARTSSS